MRSLLLTSLAATLVSPALAGDVVVTVTGTVFAANPAPSSGPFVGVGAGDAVTLHVEVFVPGVVVTPNQFVTHTIDAPASTLTIGTASANHSGGILSIQNDFPVADGVRMFGSPLVGGGVIACELGEPTGTMFTSADILQNLGTWPASIFGSYNFVLTGNGGFVELMPVQLDIALPSVGTNYCAPLVPNSTGATGLVSGGGSASLAANDLVLRASRLPNNAFGYFLCSRIQAYSPVAQAPFGVLCLASPIGRFSNQIQNTGTMGSFQIAVDSQALPQPNGVVAAVAGETWNFQAWHRDSIAGQAVANFTNGLAVTFL
jgi:hypothetical protein